MATKDGKNINKYTVEYTIAVSVNADSEKEAFIKTGRRVSKIEAGCGVCGGSDETLLRDGIELAIINKTASKQI
tara:strand:+ start:50 stop:271 length:222 start_codon:yes stop_codon:yes gene_type:complete